MSISGKHIVITGGASGLGLALVEQLWPGNQVSVIARPSDSLDRLKRRFDGIGVFPADLSDLSSVETAADRLTKDHEVIDILINNAAVQYTPHFLDDDFSYRHIRREIDVNFTSACCLIYLTLPSLLNSRTATVLNINSGLGLVPKTSSAVYCATKGAINILSQSLRHQFAAAGIQVRQAFLPLVDTAMTKGRGTGKLPPDRAARLIVQGLGTSRLDLDIGKVKALRPLARFFPGVARRIMKAD